MEGGSRDTDGSSTTVAALDHPLLSAVCPRDGARVPAMLSLAS